MISVSKSNSSARLGFGGGIEEEMMMEDSDFEEDSIHSYVSCVDPDLALSYIDDKLENVLGHFQKDFEGGVSAENLGAKYGGYGSFLSMYQRSPVCKSPPQVQHQVVSRSKCSASSAVPQVSVSGSTSKAPPASHVLVKSSNIGTPDSKQKPVTKPSCSSAPLNHKTFRLRINVGSSDLSSSKNVSTFNSKQGLNMPPSTSLVNCLSEGLLNRIHDSPTKILMAMVSFPLIKDQLLSPLSDDLIQLGKKEKIMRDAGCVSLNKSDSESRHDKLKEADKQSCEELVSKTLKLPLLSCLSDSYADSSRRTNNKDLDAPLMGSKPGLEDNPERSVKGTESVSRRKDVYLTEGETPDSLVKVGKSETRNEDQILKEW